MRDMRSLQLWPSVDWDVYMKDWDVHTRDSSYVVHNTQQVMLTHQGIVCCYIDTRGQGLDRKRKGSF